MLKTTLRHLLPVICLLLYHSVQGQHITETTWHEGYVLLKDGTKLNGQIKADMFREMVQVKEGDLTRVFTPVLVESFAFTDTNRSFLSVATHGKALHGLCFYEVKESREEGIILKKGRRIINPQSNKLMRHRTPVYRIVYDYYFLENNGLLMAYAEKA